MIIRSKTDKIGNIVDLEGKVKVCKVNIDEEPEIASAFEINVIPTISLVKDRAVIGQAVGYMPKKELLETLKTLQITDKKPKLLLHTCCGPCFTIPFVFTLMFTLMV